MGKRGILNDKVQEISIKFLGREITTTELRLLPYIDYCIKNFGKIDLKKIKQ